MARDFEGATSTGRGLFENERDVLAVEERSAVTWRLLQLQRKVEQRAQFFRCEVDFLQEMTAAKVHVNTCLVWEGEGYRPGATEPKSGLMPAVCPSGFRVR